MKRFLLIVFLQFSFLLVMAAEGINFQEGSWKTVLAKAKAENKLVFIDVYTSWCGPCKKMVADVFPQTKVSEFFNKSFVNYKIDAEKGEGIMIAKRFAVKAYPTYLFVNGDGELVYRFGGYNEAAPFLAHAANALKEKDDPNPIAKWNQEYESGKRDITFLIAYLKKRALLKLPSAEIADELISRVLPGDIGYSEFLNSVFFYDANIEYAPGGKLFAYVVSNHQLLDSISGKAKGYSLRLMQQGIRNYFFKHIIPDYREDFLPVICDAGKKISQLLQEKDTAATERRWALDYYNKTGDTIKLFPAAVDYVVSGLYKMDTVAMKAADEADYKKFREPYINGTADSTKSENWELLNRVNRSRRMITFSYQLRDAAEAVYMNSNNQNHLALALRWAEQAQRFFPHFSNLSVYAALLYKTGKKEQGIARMKQAASDSILDTNNEVKKLILENVEKMKGGGMPPKTWRL
ncbi:thioredoxin family protein [Lacibacter sediminis]|uniref:Thioredoxin family protein n=1 Tax=Lacibacter sediminis TaxID=2760713 RepID=A0A7G5XKI0_9BACT|nr:thioredoxin family protein [Lacibacter sediminis]QNA45983.1 thioredoxin family protein [Lacibacter sediminis]